MDVTPKAEVYPLLRIVMATALAAVVGWERERAERPAGLRTHMTVALAASLFTCLADRIADSSSGMDWIRIDPTRVLDAVVTGVSFLGAGTIFSARRGATIKGLTTAASLLATAAIGVATALGSYLLAIGCTAILMIVLGALRRLEIHHAGHPKDQGERAGSPRGGVTARARSAVPGAQARRPSRARSRALAPRLLHSVSTRRRRLP